MTAQYVIVSQEMTAQYVIVSEEMRAVRLLIATHYVAFQRKTRTPSP